MGRVYMAEQPSLDRFVAIKHCLCGGDAVLRNGSSVGIILCKTKNKVVVEHALRETGMPIGVSSFKLTESLPEKLRGSLPTIEELEAELSAPGTQQQTAEE